MYVVTGITGQVGGAVARSLLAAGRPVRAVVRGQARARVWSDQGCDVAMADMQDAAALQRAFADAQAVFVLLPPNFDPSPGFPESRQIIEALHAALKASQPARIVCLSTVGAQATQENLLSQLALMEQRLGDLSSPIAFLRAAWFMENAQWDIASARDNGVIANYLHPLDRAIPMVATADVGSVAAELMQESWTGHRVVELAGPRDVSPNDIAQTLAHLLGRDVRAEALPRDQWEDLFRAQGAMHPQPRLRMLEGFNEGWLRFENSPRRGEVTLETVLRQRLQAME